MPKISKSNPKSSTYSLETALQPHHLKMLLDESAISEEVVTERGYYSETVKANLGRLGFGRSQQLVPTLLAPIHGPDGTVRFHLSRPDKPRTRRGRLAKYEFPSGQPMAVDVPPRCLPNIANPSVPLIVTEGVKKGDAGVCGGVCLVDFIGLYHGGGANEQGGRAMLADVEFVAMNDR